MNIKRPLFSILICLLIPSTAYANLGTPLMWAEFLHLYLGNSVIGIVEGVLIAKIFRVRFKIAIGAMIIANYFSAILGVKALSSWVKPAFSQLTLNDLSGSIWWLVAGAVFVATVIVEYPFCLVAIKKGCSKIRKAWLTAIYASIIVQVVSYSFIFPWYYFASAKTIFTSVEVDQYLSFVSESEATIYYICDKGDICRIKPNGREFSRIIEMGDSVVFLEYEGYEDELDLDSIPLVGRNKIEDFGGEPHDFRPENERNWEAWINYWPWDGVELRRGEESFRVAFETPFIEWESRYASFLPGNLMVYQLGHQIVALDVDSRKIGVIAIGQTPVVTFGNVEEIDNAIRSKASGIQRETEIRKND